MSDTPEMVTHFLSEMQDPANVPVENSPLPIDQQAEEDERDLQIAIAGAQRLEHDDILKQFHFGIRKVAEHYAVYGPDEQVRLENRAKVIAVDEIWGYIKAMARKNQERIEEEARDRAME